MLLQNSISNTKKFFKKTFGKLRSFFSSGNYQRLPKVPPTFSGDVENMETLTNSISVEVEHESRIMERPVEKSQKTMDIVRPIPTHMEENGCNSESLRYNRKWNRICLVAEKLKELEENNNVDHALDIEEILFYYSRLTCPTYLEIVDRFFTDIFSELCNQTRTVSKSQKCSSSRIKYRLMPQSAGLTKRKSHSKYLGKPQLSSSSDHYF